MDVTKKWRIIMLSQKMNREKWVALIVAAAMMLMAPLQSFAGAGGTARAAENDKYVSEVYTAYGKDEAEAKKVLENKGYTAVSGNLNEKGKTFVMMGYKTTTDKNKAIREMAVMNSRGGYTVGDYDNLLKEEKQEIAGFLSKYMPAIKEYRANYKEGKAKAKIVHDLLNNYIENDSKKYMGDLLLADTLQDEVGIDASITSDNKGKLPDLVTILMQGNTMTINSIYELLAMAADSSDTNLVDRFAAKSYEDMMKDLEKEKPEMTEPKRVQYLKSQYETIAKTMAEETKILAKELKEYEDGNLKIDEAKKAEVEKEMGKAAKVDSAEALETAKKQASWMNTGLMYELLKNYEGGKFKKGELLKFFMEEPKGEEDVERFYPLAAALTKGQSALISITPMKQMLMYALVDDKEWAKQAREKKGKYADLMNISIYEGVDRSVFKTDGSIALTDEAKRKKAEVFPFDFGSKGIRNTLAVTATVGWAATLTCILAGVGKKTIIVSPDNGKLLENLEYYTWMYGNRGEMSEGIVKTFAEVEKKYGSAVEAVNHLKFDEAAEESMKAKSDMLFMAKQRDGGAIEQTVATGFRYVTIALALISAGVTIAALLADESVDLPPVPGYMIDVKTDKNGKKSSIAYKAALGNGEKYKKDSKNKGSAADLKAYEGKQWLTVYTTTDEKAGKPILADFKVQKEKEFPGGYDAALHIIGEKGATNLINKDYMNWSRAKELVNRKSSVFMFFKHSTETETASAFSGGMIAIITIAGVAVIALVAAMIRRSKKNSVAA